MGGSLNRLHLPEIFLLLRTLGFWCGKCFAQWRRWNCRSPWSTMSTGTAGAACGMITTMRTSLTHPPGRNSLITSYCPAITLALRSAHNLEFNGLGHQTRAILSYLTKYFSKDPHPFANTLSLAVAAFNH